MLLKSLIDFVKSAATPKPRSGVAPRRFRPGLETLEDRCVPSTWIVTNNADNGVAHTLRWAIAQAQSGDTIDILTTQPIVLTQGELYLNNNLTIEAPAGSPATINGNNISRVFEIATGNVNLDNLTVTGGNGMSVNPLNSNGLDSFGGGILNEAQLTINNCTLSSNSAAYRGGAISNSNSGNLTVNSSNLSGNSASNSGGAIYNAGGALVVNGSNLSGNSATSGGGIENGFIDSGPIATVSNCIFSGNSAEFGGGIFIAQAMAVTNSSLTKNSSTRDGGGIYNEGYVSVNNSVLSENSAGRNGGGISSGSFAKLTNSTLSGNTATNGGGIYNFRALTVDTCSLSGNSATYGGGAIFTNGQSFGKARHAAYATIRNSTLSSNSATRGAAIYNGGMLSTLHVGGSKFSHNRPDNIFGSYIDDGGNSGL
jgi:predicted outer membrane repeat protein